MLCSKTNLKLNIEMYDIHCNDDNYDDDNDDDWREEDEEYSDDDDMSWKVRRAAAKCLDAVIGTRHEMLMDFYKNVSPALIARFKGECHFHCVLNYNSALTIDYKMMFWPLLIHVLVGKILWPLITRGLMLWPPDILVCIILCVVFSEREENVKADIFHAFVTLLRQTRPTITSDPDAMEQDGGWGSCYYFNHSQLRNQSEPQTCLNHFCYSFDLEMLSGYYLF